MHTLYPPLDPPVAMDDEESDNVLPQELRENFENIQALMNSSSKAVTTSEDSKKRKESSSADEDKETNDVEAKKLRMAIKTAIAVENEITRLRNGIAELETLLAEQEGGQVVAFPSLPPVVDAEESLGGEDNDEEVDCEARKKNREMVHG